MRFLLATLSLWAVSNIVVAQSHWNSSLSANRSFIKNEGQFDHFQIGDSEILYCLDEGSTMVFFSHTGYTIRMAKKRKNPDRQRGDRSRARYLEDVELVNVQFENSSPDLRVSEIEQASHYSTYATLNPDKSQTHYEHINGYRKLVYENVYPLIDLTFSIHDEKGFKYEFVLHPGANPSDIKFKYPKNQQTLLDTEGNLILRTQFGNVIDHAPKSYQKESGKLLKSAFTLHPNSVGFVLEDFDNSKETIIDPWVVTPTFSNSGGIWDIDVDNSGNVYVYGGDTPMKLQKYDASGALQWTYNTPWDSANYWIGTMITEPATGDCFITAGTDPVISRISTAGSPLWTENGGPLDEYWKFSFNCDNTRLFLGGTRLTLGVFIEGYGYVFEIDMNNGSQLNDQEIASVTDGPLGLVSNPNEVRAMCPSPNGNYYYMTLDTIGRFDDGLNLGYQDIHGYTFSYQVAGYGVTNQSINAMAATTDHIYTTNGSVLDKRNIVDGSIILSATIPNGVTSSELGFNSAENGGLVLDSCGNVYVGSSTGVYKFDENLSQLDFESTLGAVYDVAVNSAGEVVACGQGFVGSVDLSPCAPPKAECLNCLELTPVGPFCQYDDVDTLMASPENGIWSGPGITAEVLGIFDPSVADTGTHVIYFAPEIPLECGIDSLVIEVNYCVDLLPCVNLAGDITLTNGTAPYTWHETVDTLDCSTCFPPVPPFIEPCSTPPGCAVPTTMLVEFSNDTSVTPTGNWPIIVEDAEGNSLTINSLSELPACESGCFITVNLPDTIVACEGDSAFATAVVNGGIGTVLYSWSTTPEQTTETAVDLAPGSYYWVTVIDDSLCVATDSVYVEEQECTGPTACQTPFGDMIADGIGPFTWLNFVDSTDCSGCIEIPTFPPCTFPPGCEVQIQTWEVFASGEEATSTGNWPVALVDGVGDTLFINSLSELPPCPQACYIEVDVPDQVSVCFGQSDGEATAIVDGAIGSVSYAWNTSPGQTSETATGLGVGEYIITVVDDNNCEASDTVEVIMTPEISLMIEATDSLCVDDNSGTATVTAMGGVGGYSYSWNTSPIQTNPMAVNLPAGDYEVMVTDAANCEASVSISIDNYPDVSVYAGENDTICVGDETTLVASGGAYFEWNTGEVTDEITVSPTSSFEYIVSTTNVNGCIGYDSVWVLVESIPEVFLAELDSSYCIVVPPFQVSATPPGGEFIGPGVSGNGMFDPEEAGPGSHTLIYRYAEFEDCYGEATLEVFVDEDGCDVSTPNVFNPNSDYTGQTDFCGNVPQNNVFNLPCLEWYPGNRVRIFDRWGRKHYDVSDYHLHPWDGGNHSDGVYYYILEIPEEEANKGFFHLQR